MEKHELVPVDGFVIVQRIRTVQQASRPTDRQSCIDNRVTLVATATDSRLSQVRNNVANPIVVPGVSPAPAPYDGQFIQMDVVDVLEVP